MRRGCRRLTIRSCSIAAVALGATAQAQQIPLPVDVIITESARVEEPLQRLPFAASVQQQPFSARQGLGLDEALLSVPGVHAQNRYNAAQDLRVSIRGFGTRATFGIRGIKIIVDGIPQTSPDGQTQLDNLDLSTIDRIEIRRGPSAAAFGNAAGGIIDLRTVVPNTPEIRGRVTGGAFGHRMIGIQAGDGSENWSGSVSISRTVVDGYRAHSESRSINSSARLRWNTKNSELALIVDALDAPRAQDAGGLTAGEVRSDPKQASAQNILFNAGEEVSQQKLGITYRYSINSDQVIQLRAYALDRDFTNRLPFVGGGAVTLDRTLAGGGIQWQGRSVTDSSIHRYSIGLDSDNQSDDRRRYDNLQGVIGPQVFDQNERVTSVGFFVQDAITYLDVFSIIVGARLDQIRFRVNDRFLADGDDSGTRSFSHFSPNVGISWEARKNTHVYANITTSFETPTTTELANPSGGGFDPNLRPQTATNYELGLKYIDPALELFAALFHIRSTDELVPYETPGSPGRSFFRNAGSSRRNGVEIGAKWRPHPFWTTSLAYTLSDFVFTEYVTDLGDLAGKHLPGIPKQILTGTLSFQHPAGWFCTGELRYTGRQFADDTNNTEVNSYWLAGARGGYNRTIGQWTYNAFIGVNNATQQRFFDNIRINAAGGRFFEPAPVRSVYAGASVAWSWR